MKKHTSGTKSQGGYVLLLVLAFITLFLTAGAGLITYTTESSRLEHSSVGSAQALAIAEAGIDEAASQLNANQSYTGETGTAVASGTLDVVVTTIDSTHKEIEATGYVPNKTSPTATRSVKAEISTSAAAIAFHYGVQAGSGGFNLTGGAQINGSVYADGKVLVTEGSRITGSAIAADPAATTSDQVNDTPLPITSCTTSSCITFGATSATQDFAQSFQISTAIGLNSVEFYMKKVGSPGNETVRIVNDNSGSPGTDQIMSATLSASLVGTSFGWVTVALPATPVLSPTQTYWLVIDGSSSSSNYYIVGANANGYSNGSGKIGAYGGTWSNTSPSGLDGYFQIFLGGGTSMIGGDTYTTGAYIGTTASDEAWAHTVEGATVTGPLYCQSGSYNNKTCANGGGDPASAALPVSDGNIQDWKNEASAGGIISGNEDVGWQGATLGPKEITGNLLVDGGGVLTVSGTLWVQGSVTVNGGGKVQLASSYGSNDGIIVTDGIISVSGGGSFAGSGYSGSYPFLVTTSACPAGPGCSGADAATLSGGSGAVAVIAQNGTAYITGGSGLKTVTAQEINMDNGATLTYDSGLINSNFSSGPGGSWQYVPGTYEVVQ